jgi:hypothetical protein
MLEQESMQCPTPLRYTVTCEGVIWYGETRLHELGRQDAWRVCVRDDHGERHVFLARYILVLPSRF